MKLIQYDGIGTVAFAIIENDKVVKLNYFSTAGKLLESYDNLRLDRKYVEDRLKLECFTYTTQSEDD